MVIKLNENLLAHSLKSSKICIELSGNSFGAIFLKLKDVLNANVIYSKLTNCIFCLRILNLKK